MGVAAGLALAVVAVVVAATHEGLAREDTLRRGAATLLLLGGLSLALALGSAALNLDAAVGPLRDAPGRGRLAARAGRRAPSAPASCCWRRPSRPGPWCWRPASLALGLGFDGPLAVHTLAVVLGLLVAMLACAAASSIVGPVAAGIFGGAVYVARPGGGQPQGGGRPGPDRHRRRAACRLLYYVAPRTVTSPMIADLQLRDEAGPAAPRVEINENTVHRAGRRVGHRRLDARLVRPAGPALRRRPAPAPPQLARRATSSRLRRARRACRARRASCRRCGSGSASAPARARAASAPSWRARSAPR